MKYMEPQASALSAQPCEFASAHTRSIKSLYTVVHLRTPGLRPPRGRLRGLFQTDLNHGCLLIYTHWHVGSCYSHA